MAAAGIAIGSPLAARADTQGPIDFDAYATGTVNGQDGWTSTGPFDQEIVDNSTLPGAPGSFGTQSLRISDAVTSGSFGNQTFSKSTVDAAGEPTADAGGFPTGSLQTAFIASFDFASVTPGAEQPGLHISVSPDRGDGARMSYVRIEDSPTGWNVFFDDYVDVAPLGSDGDLDDGCGAGDNFIETQIASGLSRAVPHNLQFVMQLVPGPHNDVVKVLLDGNEVGTGTSWEDYFRYCAESGGGTGGPLADQSRIVRNVLLRSSGTAHPGNAGAGFLFEDLVVTSASVPDAPTIGTATAGNAQASVSWTAPGSDGGTPVTGYVVTPFIGATPQTPQVFGSPATTQTVTGLTNGTTYTFKVAAVNLAGTGPESAASNAVTLAAAPVTGCTLAESAGAEIGHYPAYPGAQSGLTVSCAFDNQDPVPGPPNPSQVSGSYTIHDFPIAQYHNGAARTVVSVGASIPPGATTFDIDPTAAASLATWVNRPIAVVPVVEPPAADTTVLQPRTFVTSINGATGQVTLSLPTIDTNGGAPSPSLPVGTAFKIDNTIGRSFVDGVTTIGPDQVTSATASFTPADTGLSVTGTNIPANTTATYVSSTTISLSNAPTAAAAGQTITLGGTLLNTTTRQVTNASTVDATERVTTTAARFTADDVGLPVYGPNIAAGAVITAVVNATTVTLGCSTVGCGADPVTADGGPTLVVAFGDPSVTAPRNTDTAANQGVQLDLDPSLIPGADDCSSNTPEGFAIAAQWNNPGSFEGTGVFNTQPASTKAIGQLYFTVGAAPFSGYLIERRISTPGDPSDGLAHYDIVFPLVPTGLALCPSTAASPGLGFSIKVHAQTLSQQALPAGIGKPGSAQLRAVLPDDAVPGYTSAAYFRSDDPGVVWTGTPFQRICVWPPPPGSPLVGFKCGNG